MKKKLDKINILLYLIIIISIIVLIFGGIKILIWYLDSKKINDLTDKINKITPITEVDGKAILNENLKKSDPYFDYINMKLIDVDFKNLKRINKDVAGWISVSGTNINYPFVQGKDNKYYLTHAFDKSYNGGGWVFLDYRNNLKAIDKNTILYAHGRENQTMFGTLKNILKSKWFNNKENHVIRLSTEYQNTLWQVFSVYKIPNTSDYLKIAFSSNDEFKAFTDILKERSAYNFNTSVSPNDKILTLSTCYNNNEKVVMHAKLIKSN